MRTRDGIGVRAAHWPAPADRAVDNPSRGTVVLLQGRAEFIEKYHEVIGELQARSFAVTTFDWRGQGGSDRDLPDRHKGHIRHFRDFRLDYEAVRSRFPASPGPVVVLGHSMGGCIALTAAYQGWLAADRLVTAAPMVGLSLVKRAGLARAIARLLGRLGLSGRYVPGGQSESISRLPFPGNRLCTDRARYDRNAAIAAALDWGAIGSPTIGWLRAAYEAMDELGKPDVPGSIDIPTLVLAAGDDPVCSTPAIAMFARALRHGTFVEVAGSRHEIMMETDAMRSVFWDAFDAFTASASLSPGLREAAAART